MPEMTIKHLIAGVAAKDRDGLIAGLEAFYAWYPREESAAYLGVMLPCGFREWQEPEDIPEESVRCDCGTLPYEHYYIRYEKEKVPCPSP